MKSLNMGWPSDSLKLGWSSEMSKWLRAGILAPEIRDCRVDIKIYKHVTQLLTNLRMYGGPMLSHLFIDFGVIRNGCLNRNEDLLWFRRSQSFKGFVLGNGDRSHLLKSVVLEVISLYGSMPKNSRRRILYEKQLLLILLISFPNQMLYWLIYVTDEYSDWYEFVICFKQGFFLFYYPEHAWEDKLLQHIFVIFVIKIME